MKVCMLVESLPPALTGAAVQSFKLAARLRELGIEVFFAGTHVTDQSPAEDTIEGFSAYRVPYAVSGKLTKLRGLIGYCRIFARHRRQFDVLHLHGAYYVTLAAAFFATKVLGKPFLIKMTSLNSDTPEVVKRLRYGRLSWFFYRQAAAYVCMSTAQLENSRKHGLPESKLHKIPNGTDATRYRPASSDAERAELLTRLGLSEEFHYVVFIGHIEKTKGIDLLVDIAVAVCARRRDVKFLVIGPDGSAPGEGYIRPEFVADIRSKIRAAGLQDHVLLLGCKSNTEEYLRMAALFLFTSRSEGFGTVLIEAMATGLPSVALKIRDVTTDIITSDRDGIIVETEDPNAFAKTILQLLDDPARAREIGTAARKTVLERFELSAVARRYLEVYEKVATTR
jgi:glycosyltransferase involved in cell wall biosynthesis